MIRKTTMTEIFDAPNITELMEEYAAESSIHGLPHPKAKIDLYKQLETVGILYAIGAFFEDTLVGFILIVSPIVPHYSAKISTTESFFVAKEYRKTGAGIKLRQAAESHAREIGSVGLLISAPLGSNLAEMLSCMKDYKETNRVFFKGFNDT
jgi:GNAT superfamily N-acetyltransferase